MIMLQKIFLALYSSVILTSILCSNQEMIRLMRERKFSAAFKCYHNFHKVGFASPDDLYFKMVIHVHSDSVFRRYQKEMRYLLNSNLSMSDSSGLFLDL